MPLTFSNIALASEIPDNADISSSFKSASSKVLVTKFNIIPKYVTPGYYEN